MMRDQMTDEELVGAFSYNGAENNPGTCLQVEGVLRKVLAKWRFEKAKVLVAHVRE